MFKLSSESKHLGLLFQLVDQLKQFVPNLPVSAAHKTLTFRLKHMHDDFPNPPISSGHKNGRMDINVILVPRPQRHYTTTVIRRVDHSDVQNHGK